MHCILHGYLLDGSGSCLWTRSILEAVARSGQDIHLFCQEPHPDKFPFISEAYRYTSHKEGDVKTETLFKRDSPNPGRVICHQPLLGNTLPVYVKDKYEEFENVVPMIDLPDAEIEKYLKVNTDVLKHVIKEWKITSLYVNHVVLQSVVAQRIQKELGTSYVVMPHGSAIEYTVKKDKRFLKWATAALNDAKGLVSISPEIRTRLKDVFGPQGNVVDLPLGVDTSLFKLCKKSERKKIVTNLCKHLASLPKGETADGRYIDLDLEEKLVAVDWDHAPTLLFVGRLIRGKGFHVILMALPELLSKIPDLQVLVVGHGPMREVGTAMIEALQKGDEQSLEKLLNDGDGKPLTEAIEFVKGLKSSGQWEAYLKKAAAIKTDRILYTGYLTHTELWPLFSSTDCAIFPSMVAEAGPLVFLEAMSSGAFPMGTYIAGIKAQIDRLEGLLSKEDLELMKLSPDSSRTVKDVIQNIPKVLETAEKNREPLRKITVEKSDWSRIAKLFQEILDK